MDQKRRPRVERLFHSALDLEPKARRAFLDSACGGDTELRHQVELLLVKGGEAGTFLEVPAMGYTTDTEIITATHLGRQFGPYRIVSPLGSGGMGDVYRAHDSKLGRDVAIKTLPAEFVRDPERLARFRREARTLASLNHPNIAAIYGLEKSGEVDCLVLELVEGENLCGPLALDRALDYARQVAEGLEAAHEKGIIHRDLKPANVKVTPKGRVKVLDFGLAKAIWGPEGNPNLSQTATVAGEETLAGHILGTPGYMSPEQTRGEAVDERTDIWAFGCLLYELLTGQRAFHRESHQETIAAVLEQEPDWPALPPKTPTRIRALLRACLQKDPSRRLHKIADARRTLAEAQHGRNRWRNAVVAAAALAVLGIAAILWLRSPNRPSDRSQWVPLTRFPDAVSQPALSSDGRMLAFIRGDSTFFGPGQIYVKILPDGDPKQLTHDSHLKMSPAFSPDGTRIAYTVVSPPFKWDTWVVPVLGGEPEPWLKNASGLVWTGLRQLLFSEIRMGLHMAIVQAAENRMGEHDVYVPAEEPEMAHRSYLSPDRKSVLLVEMDEDHAWVPCRVVPADGSSPGHRVGPPGGGCTSGAWAPDGKWMYVTSNAAGGNHIWRQRFPDGTPEQVTFGPTEEEGTAMAADGRSLVTAVSLQNASLWVHDSKGEHPISVEGNAADPRFTPDGKKLLFRIVREAPNEFIFYRDLGEVQVADLNSGRSEPLAAGIQTFDYDLSPDGRQVVMERIDGEGKARLFLTPLDRNAAPRQIPNVEGVQPRFGPGNEIFFRGRKLSSHAAGTSGLVYRVHADGTGLHQAFDKPVLILTNISPDGRWALAWALLPGNGPPAFQAFPLGGSGPPIKIFGGVSGSGWAPGGRSWYVSGMLATNRTYFFPLRPGEMLPPIPPGGFHAEEEVLRVPGARRIDAPRAVPGPSLELYAFYRGTTQRNLYRIPVR